MYGQFDPNPPNYMEMIELDSVGLAFQDSLELAKRDSILKVSKTIKLPEESVIISEVFRVKPLDTLIYLAILNSKQLKSQDIFIANKEASYKLNKRGWMRLLSVSANYLYGSTNLLSEQSDGVDQNFNLSTSTSGLYNMGVTLRVSPDDFFNRGLRNQVSKLEWERTVVEREILEKAIREEVIRRYNDLLFAVEVIQLKAKTLQAAKASQQVSEEFYKEGSMSTSSFSSVLTTFYKIEEEYLSAKYAARRAYLLLQEFVGSSIRP